MNNRFIVALLGVTIFSGVTAQVSAESIKSEEEIHIGNALKLCKEMHASTNARVQIMNSKPCPVFFYRAGFIAELNEDIAKLEKMIPIILKINETYFDLNGYGLAAKRRLLIQMGQIIHTLEYLIDYGWC